MMGKKKPLLSSTSARSSGFVNQNNLSTLTHFPERFPFYIITHYHTFSNKDIEMEEWNEMGVGEKGSSHSFLPN